MFWSDLKRFSVDMFINKLRELNHSKTLSFQSAPCTGNATMSLRVWHPTVELTLLSLQVLLWSFDWPACGPAPQHLLQSKWQVGAVTKEWQPFREMVDQQAYTAQPNRCLRHHRVPRRGPFQQGNGKAVQLTTVIKPQTFEIDWKHIRLVTHKCGHSQRSWSILNGLCMAA